MHYFNDHNQDSWEIFKKHTKNRVFKANEKRREWNIIKTLAFHNLKGTDVYGRLNFNFTFLRIIASIIIHKHKQIHNLWIPQEPSITTLREQGYRQISSFPNFTSLHHWLITIWRGGLYGHATQGSKYLFILLAKKRALFANYLFGCQLMSHVKIKPCFDETICQRNSYESQ